MNIQQIRYVVETALAGSFSAASDKLYITEPTISQQIRKLEQELGVTLFERTTRSVELTPSGKVFIKNAMPVLASFDHLNEAMHTESIRSASRITLVMTTSEQLSDVMRLSIEFETSQDIVIEVKPVRGKDLKKELSTGRADIAVTKLTYDYEDLFNSEEFSVQILRQEHMNVLASGKLISWDKQSISFKELNELPIICESPGSPMENWIIERYKRSGLEARISMYAQSPEIMIAAVENGMGIAFSDESAVRHYYDKYRFNSIPLEPGQQVNLCLITPRSKKTSAAVKAFCKVLKEYYSS